MSASPISALLSQAHALRREAADVFARRRTGDMQDMISLACRLAESADRIEALALRCRPLTWRERRADRLSRRLYRRLGAVIARVWAA